MDGMFTRRVMPVTDDVIPMSKEDFGKWLEEKMAQHCPSVGNPLNPTDCPLHHYNMDRYGRYLAFTIEQAQEVIQPDEELPYKRIPQWTSTFQLEAMASMDMLAGISPAGAMICLQKS